MHSCCRQVKDFLDYGRELHGEIQHYYDDIAQHDTRERLKLLLTHLSRHEQNLQDSLLRYEQVTRKDILDRWLSHVPRVDLQSMCAPSKSGVRSLEDVVDTALRFDAAMIKLYRDAAEHAGDGRVKELFRNIADMETQGEQNLLLNVSMLNEM